MFTLFSKRKILTRLLPGLLTVACFATLGLTEAHAAADRVWGATRYETSFEVANRLKQELGVRQFNDIVVASGTNFPDALSGSYLATKRNAPILLVNDAYIDEVVTYIQNNLSHHGTVYILGGNSAVSETLDSALNKYNVKRLYGENRYETNIAILNEVGLEREILVSSAHNYADCLSISSLGKPILLVGDSLTDSQKNLNYPAGTHFVIIGGTSAVPETVESELRAIGSVERVGGQDRYETSVMVAKRFFHSPDFATLVYGKNYPDGLCAGPLSYAKSAPVLLTVDCNEGQADAYTQANRITNGSVIGGDSQLSNRAVEIVFSSKPYVGHEYTSETIAPTCTKEGFTTHTCSVCGHTKKDSYVKATGHNYGNTVVTQPTCTKEGYSTETCSVCQKVKTDSQTKALGHNYKTTKVEATTGWAGYDLHECIRCNHSYKDNETKQLSASSYPKGYRDETCEIIIYKEWYENAYVYAAHVTFTDYDRLWVECANGKYNSGGETTSKAAKRVGAILAINGDYATPGNGAGGYAIARKGVVCNDGAAYPEGVYNSNTGLLTFGHSGRMLSELVAEGLVTDTFQFGPVCLKNGEIIGDPNSNSRAQRTFIGTNGNAGDIWLCVSDGRSNDGQSTGLNGYQCGAYLKTKGCTLCVPLDGGGSSTIYFNGQVLNAAKSSQRAVADFVMFK